MTSQLVYLAATSRYTPLCEPHWLYSAEPRPRRRFMRRLGFPRARLSGAVARPAAAYGSADHSRP